MASPGALTYDELLALTKQALGGRNTGLMDDAWYGDRINSAYSRLVTFQGYVLRAGASQPQFRVLRFYELYSDDDRTISTGSDNFVTPAATADVIVSVDNVYDLTNNRRVRRKAYRWMMRKNPDDSGTPTSWCPGGKDGPGYFINPRPTTSSHEISVRETTYQYPDELSTGETPVIPSAWHKAIWLAAASEAAQLIDWPEKSQEYEGLFMQFIAERRSPVEEAGPGGGRRFFTVGRR